MSVIFHDSEFYFKNSFVFLKFVKIREFYKLLKFIKFAFSVYDFTSNPTTLNPNPNQGAVDFRSRCPGGGQANARLRTSAAAAAAGATSAAALACVRASAAARLI